MTPEGLGNQKAGGCALRRHSGPIGQVEIFEHRSRCLVGNPLGDDPVRRVAVYLPPGYDHSDSRRYPLLVDLVGYTGSGLKHVGWQGFGENVPERLDRLIGEGAMPPAIVAFPDCFTALGGNQYIDSSAIGSWATYLTNELVPWLDESFSTFGARDHRGVFGKSSGGYGALMHGMLHSDVWGGIVCHSGDMYFLYGYLTDFPLALDGLSKYDRSVEKFLDAMAVKKKYRGSEIHTLMTIAMAATYDPDPSTSLGFRMPMDLHTGELDEERWAQWLRHDPVEVVEDHVADLRSLRCLYIDVGTQDQYRLHYGARILHERLDRLEVAHHYDEFDDNHSSIDYRLDASLPILVKSLSP